MIIRGWSARKNIQVNCLPFQFLIFFFKSHKHGMHSKAQLLFEAVPFHSAQIKK